MRIAIGSRVALFGLLIVTVVGLVVHPISSFAQGPINPTGTPGPTMKSLDQIEARTPISSLPFVISSGGSYYLTKSLNIASGDAITISASGVTVDLNGFEITSTESSPAHSGILIGSGLANIRVQNGSIRGNVAFNGSTFSGSGFANGILATGTWPLNATISHISVGGCLSNGIDLGFTGLVESCSLNTIGSFGIRAGTVVYCNANQCGTIGITALNVTGCSVTMTSTGDTGIGGDTVTGCVATGHINSGEAAIRAETARDCYAFASSGDGHGVLASTAENCEGISGGAGDGIHVSRSASNCYGAAGNGTGISAAAAENCYGVNSGNAPAVNVTSSALNCYGTNSGSGLNAIGLSALTAQSCTGQSLGINGGPGIKATEAVGCYGSSVCAGGINAPGVSALSAQSCYGASAATSASIGVHATNASFCYGQIGSNNAANGDYAILSQIAFCCSGSPATNTTNGSTVNGVSIYFSGSGSSPYP